MAHDGDIGSAFAIHMHNIGLRRKTVPHLGNIAQGHNNAVANGERQLGKLRHGGRAGIDGDIIFALANACHTGRHNHIGALQGGDNIAGRNALGRHLRRVDINNNLSGLAAIGRGKRDARNGKEFEADEVERVVENLLLGNCFARCGHLHHADIGGAKRDQDRRCHAGGQHTQNLIIDRIDLRHGAAQFSAGFEKDFDDTGARQRLAFNVVNTIHALCVSPLCHEHHAAFHIFRRQAAVIPCHQHDRNIDGRKNIHDHARERQSTGQKNNKSRNGRRIGTPQRDVN